MKSGLSLAIAVVLLTLVACGPAPFNIDVVEVQGSVSTNIVPGKWELGEIKMCEKVKYPLRLPQDKEATGDSLLCGPEASRAWQDLDNIEKQEARQGVNVDSLRDRLLVSGKIFAVTTKNHGVRGWMCRRTAEGLVCE